jgi:hypothetical protein
MGVLAAVNRLRRALQRWVWSLGDSIPPYRVVKAPLDAKEAAPNGKFYIYVRGARVEIDGATFDILTAGEMIRVRYTRGHRAINIDVFLPENNSG